MSFQQGLSGLNATSRNLDVIGNNIANASTVGAKSSRAEFADLYAGAIGGSSGSQPGSGVRVAAVAQQFTQGNITATENPMDVAIDGQGFFKLSNGDDQIFYSRNGQFKLNEQGYMVNNDGLYLLGNPVDASGVPVSGVAEPMEIPTKGIQPRETDGIEIEFNLDSRASPTEPTDPTAPKIDFADSSTYNESTAVTVYDGLGQPIQLKYYFQKDATAANTWNVYVTANGETLSGTDAAPQPLAQQLVFTNNGNTITPNSLTLTDISPNPSNGVTYVPIDSLNVSLVGSTQFASEFSVTALSQTGYTTGQLAGVAIDDDGTVTARYTNGQKQNVGRIEIASFRNPQGLQPVGSNNWIETRESGEPVAGVPGTGNLGQIQAGAVEESNVDLTLELVGLITAQRNYQANAQTIKTQDQVMQTLMSMR
ncbi:flagellar hook protein FlgE [Ideonella livida]|uniref:Flagellar hook protein FlgE n=1 Tax=Ideonella livida TaxID=2707176 RepID=A0A7C9TGW7_9BURK|nr:flagellar hook protein FlgE [Ideonella livida]NDY89958.1 flagellar hook protein FlgE [Ideonella livida]